MDNTILHLWKGMLIVFLMQGLTRITFAQTTEEHYNVGLTYPISSNGTRAKQYTNTFSLNAAVGLSASEKGLSIAGFSNIIFDSAAGVQIAGFSNNIYGHAEGVQVAGFMNYIRKSSTGFLGAGFMNVMGSAGGVNVAGFGNICRRNSSALQIAGFINKAGDAGTQIAGFINVAKKVKGIQIAGFINVADSSDCPIGFLNFIKNGEKSIGVSTDETLTTLATFRSGGRKLYGITGLGYNNKGSRRLAAWEVGLGWHLPITDNFRLNTEIVNIGLTDFKNGECFKSSLRVLPALRLTHHIEIFAGPSFNYLYSYKGQGADLIDHYVWSEKKNRDLRGLYFGWTGGVAVRL
ncbi:MAG TPA: hypothetical protein VL832_18105 [Puia sp.]|nr:hypothetical protein [Puia sp.]